MSAIDRASGRALLKSLKATAGTPGPCVGIPVGQPVEAVLRPVATHLSRLNANDVKLLTDWRNRFVSSFLTDFVATEKRTAHWLAEFVGTNENKILFMLDVNGQTVGNIGLDFINWETGYGEADNIVKGGSSRPGLMKLALQTTLGWAVNQLGLSELGVRVRSDNTALDFYRKVGFKEFKRVPLRKIEEPGMVRWVEEPGMVRWVEDPAFAAASASLVYMTYAA